MRFKVMGWLPAALFTTTMLFLVVVGIMVIKSGHHYEGVSIITLGGWTELAWLAGYGMHAWKRHSQVIGEIRSSLKAMETQLARQPQPVAQAAGAPARHLMVVPPR